MSILAEIAQRADVSVEGVMRVLTREPVSWDVKERVLGVLDDLSPEQTRMLQRFALAALHDELPRDAAEPAEVLPAVSSSSHELETRLAPILEELGAAVKDLRREANAERRERVDDLALLVDVITTGWQGLDRRLGRVERVVSRIDSAGRTPPAVAAAPRAEAAPVVAQVVAEEPTPTRRSTRWPIGAALVVGLGLGLLAGLDVLPTPSAVSHLSADRDSTSAETEAARPTTATQRAATTARTRTRPAATTTAPRRSTRGTTRPSPPPVGTTAPKSTAGTTATTSAKPSTGPATTASPPQTTTRGASSTGFTPARDWGWVPVEGADYYVVQFFRGGKPFYRATPAGPSLKLPASVVFGPGEYRWVVRPGFGRQTERRLGNAVVDSKFEIAR